MLNLFSKLNIILFYIFFLITLILFPLIVFLLVLIKPILTIRITMILSNRYGHLSLNPMQYLLTKKEEENNRKYLDLFFASRYGICNKELFNIWKKKIIILPRILIEPSHLFLNKVLGKQNPFTIPNFDYNGRDINFYRDLHKPSFNLTKNQIKKCEDILLLHNIDIRKIKYVCLFNRDDAYLNSFKHKKNWYYLSHHNYKIDKFLLAANALNKKNIYVFRMGAKVEEKFGENNPMIIDYANLSIRSELMDIYLASKCLFAIGTGTGAIGVAEIYRKPILDLNANLHHMLTYLKNCIMLSKHYYSKRLKRNLKLKEIMKYEIHELQTRIQLDEEEIEMVDCTEEEIMNASIELLEKIEKNWLIEEKDKSLQDKFKNNYDNSKTLKAIGLRYHNDIIRANYSSSYLSNNQEWLD